MRTLKTIAVAATLAAVSCLLGGCWTLSMNPLYTENDLVAHDEFDPGLAGVWGDTADPDAGTWQFIEAEDHSYRLIVRGHE